MAVLERIEGRGDLSRWLSSEVRFARREIRHGRFQRVMALMSVFAAIVTGFESYTQHSRGAFSNRWMWTPVWLTAPMVAAGAAALFSERVARRLLPLISLWWVAAGVAGFLFHVGGIRRLPGGFKLGQYNIVVGPPVFAPLLAISVGLLGLLAALLRRGRLMPRFFDKMLPAPVLGSGGSVSEPGWMPRHLEAAVEHGRFQRGMVLATAFFGILAGGEAYFEHLRGSFNRRVMWTPVWVTPVLVLTSFETLWSGFVGNRLLPVVSLLASFEGLAGFLFHLQGIHRMPGGFANFFFNVTKGPPLFAPLLFASTGLLGMIAALMRRRED